MYSRTRAHQIVACALAIACLACGTPEDADRDGGRPVDAEARGDGSSTVDGGVTLDATPSDAAPPAVDGGVPSDAGPPGEWQLAPGHFYPAVMPMTLVYPRPDAETAAHARHRWAYPGIAYRIPAAVVQGGAWPFHYELVEGPAGATIGEQLATMGDVQVAGPDYGVVTWTPTLADEGRAFTFVVRVTDQEGASVEARWTTTVDSSRFLFLSPSGSPSNPGTLERPMRDVADWYRGDPDDATYAGRLVYFRGGRYTPIGQDGNENLRMEAGVKPMTFMAYPGEVPVLDATRAAWTFWDGVNDVFFAGLRFEGSKTRDPSGAAIANARTISFYGPANHERIAFFEVQAHDTAPGSVGTDNPAFVWRPSSGTRRGRYWAFVNNVFDTAGPITSNGPSAVSLSCVSYVVYEGNTVTDWDGTGTFYDKANDDHMTYRNNDLWDVGTARGPHHTLGAGMSDSYDTSHQPGYAEVAWNRIRVAFGTGAPFAVSAGVSATSGTRGPVWVYRNSIYGTVDFVQTGRYMASFDRNVLQGRAARDADMVISAGDNFWSTNAADTVFSETGALAGAVRSDHLGLRGAEVR